MGISKIVYNEYGNNDDDDDEYINEDNHEKTAPASNGPAPRCLKHLITICVISIVIKTIFVVSIVINMIISPQVGSGRRSKST